MKKSHIGIIVLIIIIVLVGIGCIFVYNVFNDQTKPTAYKNEEVATTYSILQGDSWKDKFVTTDIPIEWNIPSKNVVIKKISESSFSCGSTLANFSIYTSYTSGSNYIGGWYSTSVIDCGDYYFVYENGDSGPKLFGPFDKNTPTTTQVSWKTYTNPEHQFKIQYPSDWVVETGVGGTIVRFRPSNQVQKPDTDTPIDQVFVRQETSCSFADWNTGFADASYKHLCINPLDLGIDMVALSAESKPIENKMASSFVNTGSVVSAKEYINNKYSFAFKYPSDLTFVPLHTSFVSLADGVEADIPALYNLSNSFQRSQKIYVGVTSATTQAMCMPTDSADPQHQGPITQIKLKDSIANLAFNKYQTKGDCAMDGCTIGNTYDLWYHNSCYQISWFAIQANPEKSYDGVNDPRTISAEKSAGITTKKITDLTEKILSTFGFMQ